MGVWALLLFLLGAVMLLFHIFEAPQPFSYLWAVILMAIALAMLYRIAQKEKEGEKEKLLERLGDLESKLSKEREVASALDEKLKIKKEGEGQE